MIVTLSDEAYALSQNYEISNVPSRQDSRLPCCRTVRGRNWLANGALLAPAEHTAGSKAAFQDLMQSQKVQSILVDSDKINEVDRAEWLALVPELTNLTGLVEQEEGVRSRYQVNAIILAAVLPLVSRHPELLDNTKIDAKLFRQGTDDQFEMHNSNQMLAGRFMNSQVDGLMSSDSS